jgi:hypothetical protein
MRGVSRCSDEVLEQHMAEHLDPHCTFTGDGSALVELVLNATAQFSASPLVRPPPAPVPVALAEEAA